MNSQNLIFRQLFDKETSTYTYIVADPNSMDGIIIDPVLENEARDLQLLKELGITLKYIFETHVHADHVTGAAKLRSATGAKVAFNEDSGVSGSDLLLADSQMIELSGIQLKAIKTPGHTSGCMCFLVNDEMLFSGDTLLFRGTGRTDFQQGSNEKMFESIREKLFVLADNTRVYPGHDYKGFTQSTIGEEKAFNPRVGLKVSFEEFSHIMDNLNLAKPKRIDVAVPANLSCGQVSENA
jgi:glyoxylase-like metal-dependent hydrolase (beta-lactamase superfamily II)